MRSLRTDSCLCIDNASRMRAGGFGGQEGRLHAKELTCGHGNGEAHANEGVGERHDSGNHAHQPDPACMRTCLAGKELPLPAHILCTAKFAGVCHDGTIARGASPRCAATWWACVSPTGLHGAWLFAMHKLGRSGGMPPCLSSAAVSYVPPVNVLDLREDDLQGAHEEDPGRL